MHAADARDLEQISRHARTEVRAHERIDRGGDALRIDGAEHVALDERRVPGREMFGDDGDGVAHPLIVVCAHA